MAKTLKDLLLALLNATLILLALCLFLGWKLAQSVETVRDGFAENLQVVAPLRDQTQEIRDEISGLRGDLTAIRNNASNLDFAAKSRLSAALDRLNDIEARLENTQTRLAGLVDNPEDLINYAVTTSSEAAAEQVMKIRGCVPAS